MKRVFLDTNVILDFTQNRGGADAAEMILHLGEKEEIEVCTSFLSMANVAYIARKGRTKEQLYKVMKEISTFIHTLPMDEEQLQAAIAHPASDFEDMLQYQCALYGGCDVIVTRNTRHFSFSMLPLCTPQEFLDDKQLWT